MESYKYGIAGEEEGGAARENGGGSDVVLGLDGGATSTVCVCLPLIPVWDPQSSLPDPLPVLSRAVGGCSNFNSVGGHKFFIYLYLSIYLSFVVSNTISFGFVA